MLLTSLALINRWIGQIIAYLVLAMAVLTVVIVVLRYGFAVGSIAAQELVMYFHVTLFMLGLGYALQSDSHVRVDILYSRAKPTTKNVINLVGHLIFLVPLCVVLITYSWDYVVGSWRVLEASPEVGGIPGIFLLKSLIPISAILLLLQALLEAVQLITKLRNRLD